jgi:putative intracellular protease/amidase
MKKLLLALPLLLLPLGAFAQETTKFILLVVTNHAELGDTGKKTGFYLSEAAHPYKVFDEKNYFVTLASPEGGFVPIDPKSMDLKDPANKSFWEKHSNMNEEKPGLPLTKALSEVDPAKYSAIFFAGGHGAVWDFPENKDIKRITSAIYEKGGAVGAVCHGPAALVNVKLSDGSLLIAGKKTAVFTNSEEEAVKLTETVPFLLQTAFEKAGAKVIPAKDFSENAIRDGRLVTGQNPASAKKAAELLLEAMGE